MDASSLLIILVIAYAASIGGGAMLWHAIVCRSRKEARREVFGLSPRLDPWP